MAVYSGPIRSIAVSSEKYSQASIQALLERLDGEAFVQQLGLGNGDFAHSTQEDEIRCYCPVCRDRGKMTFIIECLTRRAYCANLYCDASNMNAGGGNLIELFALAKGLSHEDAVEQLAKSLEISLIKRQEPGAAIEARTENFEFVEVARYEQGEDSDKLEPAPIAFGNQKALGRGVYIQLSQLEDFVAKFHTNVYWSHFRYGTNEPTQIESLANQGQLATLGDYYVVFNASSSAEIVHAINQAIDLVERLKENYDVPYDAVYVFYTNHNIEVHVDGTVFGITPTQNLPEIFRRMTCAIIGVDPLKPERSAAFSQIDLNVYRHDFLTPVPGTMLSAGNREIYKIRMSYSAFKKMSYQRLHEFSLRRPDLPPRERWDSLVTKARDFFASVKSSMQRDSQLDEGDTIASLFYRVQESHSEIATLRQLAPTLLRRLFDENRQLLYAHSGVLNRALGGGLYPGQVYVVAGFPGSGTSTFVLQLMNYIASQQNVQCLFIGLQRGVEEVFKRSLSNLGKIPANEIDDKRRNPAELYEDKDFNRRIFAAYERYQQFASNITILEGAAAANLSRISNFIREKREDIKAKTGRASNMLLVVDSLQLLVAMMRSLYLHNRMAGSEAEGETEYSQWDVDSLTSRLKALARELDITIIATFEHFVSHRTLASQLSENDPAYRQLLNSTQFADTVMMLSRQGASLLNLRDYFRTSLAGTPLENRVGPLSDNLARLEGDYRQTKEFRALRSEFAVLDILKNRNGTRDKVLYVYHKPISLFEPIDYHGEVPHLPL
jgi:replicative DNA helicase